MPRRNKKIKLYIDMDDVLAKYSKYFLDRGLDPNTPRPPGLFRMLEPDSTGIDAMYILDYIGCFDMYVVSKVSMDDPREWADKVAWCNTHLPPFMKDRLILTPTRSLFSGGILVDDDVRNRKGFRGLFIHFGSEDYPDWTVVFDKLVGMMVGTSQRRRVPVLLR